MQFYSTNGQCAPASLEQAVMTGLAPDGGLYLPEEIPLIPRAFYNNIGEMTVADIAYVVACSMLGSDIDAAELREIVRSTFTFPVPLRHIGSDPVYALELFHGPTLAFKDVGARFLARIISHYSRGRSVNVLVATSGDSGGAVAAGFHRVKGVRVFVLYPERGLTPMQRSQFTTLGDNVHPIEVRGNFDDCQRLVKEAFMDPDLRSRMSITSANSINICRLLPQMFYYFHAYSQLLPQCHRAHQPDPEVVISVPSGNLGNLTAGLLAKRMGLPVKRFVVANNANSAFVRYLDTGTFAPAPPVRTIACAMDVGNPSNIARIRRLYRDDRQAMRADMHGYTLSDDDIRRAMVDTSAIHSYLLDPHGAAAYAALRADLGPGEHGIFLATAHPAKFASTVEACTGVRLRDIPAAPAGSPAGPIPRISPSLEALRRLLR